jgi:hypothetical protein
MPDAAQGLSAELRGVEGEKTLLNRERARFLFGAQRIAKGNRLTACFCARFEPRPRLHPTLDSISIRLPTLEVVNIPISHTVSSLW